MEREPDKSSEKLTLEHITKLAKEILLEHGSHLPTLVVEGSLQNFVLQLQPVPPTAEDRARFLFFVGLFTAQDGEIGDLRQAFFVSEAWLSTIPVGETLEVPPSEDSNRTEVLTIAQFRVADASLRVVIHEMIRDHTGKLQDLRDMLIEREVRAESFLLDAFLRGFTFGLTK